MKKDSPPGRRGQKGGRGREWRRRRMREGKNERETQRQRRRVTKVWDKTVLGLFGRRIQSSDDSSQCRTLKRFS
jgi:hypothetical protein